MVTPEKGVKIVKYANSFTTNNLNHREMKTKKNTKLLLFLLFGIFLNIIISVKGEYPPPGSGGSGDIIFPSYQLRDETCTFCFNEYGQSGMYWPCPSAWGVCQWNSHCTYGYC